MTKLSPRYQHLIFFLIVILQLTATLIDSFRIEYIVKPMIMLWVIWFFLSHNQNPKLTRVALMAFIFSLLGDVLLMFSWKDELWFFAGVGGFFMAQLSYIWLFTWVSGVRGKGIVQRKPLLILPFIAYVAAMFLLLLPGMDGIMRVIIGLYALSLMFMSMEALNRNGRVAYTSFLLVFIGSLLFLLSDSMIAVNRFHTEIPLSGFWIMLTYMAAQYLIVLGLVREKA